jgi:hypothetical protein
MNSPLVVLTLGVSGTPIYKSVSNGTGFWFSSDAEAVRLPKITVRTAYDAHTIGRVYVRHPQKGSRLLKTRYGEGVQSVPLAVEGNTANLGRNVPWRIGRSQMLIPAPW